MRVLFFEYMFLEFLNQSEPHIVFVYVLVLIPNDDGASGTIQAVLRSKLECYLLNDGADLFLEVCWSDTHLLFSDLQCVIDRVVAADGIRLYDLCTTGSSAASYHRDGA